MPTFSILRSSRFTLVLFLLLGSSYDPGAAARAAEAPATAKDAGPTPAQQEGTAPPAQSPAGTPVSEEAVKAEATKTAETCKKVIGDLGAKASAADSLPEDRRAALLNNRAAEGALTCLAVAHGNRSYCDLLADEAKGKCEAQFALAAEIKGLPKGQIKAHIIHKACLHDSPKADCDAVLAAMKAGDAAKCKGVSKAVLFGSCAALATGDAAKCKEVPAGEQRSYCEAYASEDPGRCPKESVDCRNLAKAFASFKKGGLAAVESIDPSVAAAVKGKDACTSSLAELEKHCIAGPGPSGEKSTSGSASPSK